MNKFISILSLLLLCQLSFGQHNPLVSHYMINSLPLNPAFTGSRDALSISINYRKQWVNFNQSPSTATLSVHTTSKKTNIGYGLLFINDEIGVSRQTGLMGNFAYHLKTSRGKLNFGLSGGMFNYTNNWSEIIINEENDDVFSRGDESFWGVDFSVGLYYYERNFYVSLSSPFILNNQYKNSAMAETEIYKNTANQNFFLTSGYKFELKGAFNIIPSFLVKYVTRSPIQLDINCLIEYDDILTAGVGLRGDDAIIALLKYQINSKFGIGYAVDFSMNEIKSYSQGSHEITLLFDMIDKTKSKSAKFF